MEDRIVSLLERGERDAAFEAILDLLEKKVYRLVFSILRSPAHAEDVTQDVFLKVWQALPAWDGRASPSTWIYTIARNTALSYVRAASWKRTEPLTGVPEETKSSRPDDAVDVRRMLAQLPESQREVVELFYLQERSIQDVASMLDLPEGTVKSILHRSRKAMAAMMGAGS